MSKIKLNNVRINFSNIFKTEIYKGVDTLKYTSTFLIDKNDKAIKKQIDEEINRILLENKIKKLAPDKICIKDGDESEYELYHGMWSLKASNAKRPTVIDRDKTPLTLDDNKIYNGCHVNAIIDLWFQDNDYGKRINANLYGIQFLKDGEPFGQGPVDVAEEFEDLDL